VAQFDLVDQTWIRAKPPMVADAVARPDRWGAWWPGLSLRADELRGLQGIRWSALAMARWSVRGEIEIWLQPDLDGVLLNFLARLDRGDGTPMAAKEHDRLGSHLTRQAKRNFWQLKDELESDQR
jgi:hypothetical protein